MWSTPSLALPPGPVWLRVVAPDRVLSMGQIEQTVCKQMNDASCDCYRAILETICVQKRAQARLTMLSTKCVYKIMYNLYV